MHVFLQSILPKEDGFGLTGAHQQPSLPSLGVGYKHSTYGATHLPKIPVATTTHTTTFPTSFPSIIHQEKNKVKVIDCTICCLLSISLWNVHNCVVCVAGDVYSWTPIKRSPIKYK